MSSTADFPSCHFCLVLSHLPSPSQPAPKLPASQRPAVNNLHLDTSTRPSAAKRIFPSQVRISNCHSQLCWKLSVSNHFFGNKTKSLFPQGEGSGFVFHFLAHLQLCSFPGFTPSLAPPSVFMLPAPLHAGTWLACWFLSLESCCFPLFFYAPANCITY